MYVYIYKNYISDDEEVMEEKVELIIGETVHDIGTVEVLAAQEVIKEVKVNPQDLFRYMRKGYIFLAHCGVEL